MIIIWEIFYKNVIIFITIKGFVDIKNFYNIYIFLTQY